MTAGAYATDGVCKFACGNPWLVLDTANHGLQWFKNVDKLSTIVDGQYLVYAFSDGLKSCEDVLGSLYDSAKYVAGQRSLDELGTSLWHTSISVCDFVGNAAVSVSVLADLKIMKAVPGLSTTGNLAGLWSSSWKLIDDWDAFSKGDGGLVYANLMFRIGVVAINIICLSPALMGVKFSAEAFLYTTTLILAAQWGQKYFAPPESS